MAISVNTVFEVRTTGAQTNGGGFVTGASGTDYSQQDAAQYALTGVTTAAAGAICLHASSAAVMVGNICRIVSGTNFTVGWYEIISVVAGVSFTLDRNCTTAAGALGVINIGGAFKFGGTLDDDFTEGVIAGNTIHIASGSYTLGEAIAQTVPGTTVAPITWIGYTTTRGDACVGTNRPLFVCGSNTFQFFTYAIFRNIRGTGSGVSFNIGGYSVAFNCKFENSTTGQAFTAVGNVATLISCEGICTGGSAFNLTAQSSAINCYAHDSTIGFNCVNYGNRVLHCIVDTCMTGIALGANYKADILNNTIYNCTTGISGSTAYVCNFINNVITGCTTGASWTTATPINFWDYNCWNNTTDVSNVTKGPHDVTANPLLVSGLVSGTDGATGGTGLVFTAASAPFSGVTTSDCLLIKAVGTGATLGVYTISSVDSTSQLTLATSAGASKTGITYGIVKGADFTLASGSPCFDAGLQMSSDVGVT